MDRRIVNEALPPEVEAELLHLRQAVLLHGEAREGAGKEGEATVVGGRRGGEAAARARRPSYSSSQEQESSSMIVMPGATA